MIATNTTKRMRLVTKSVTYPNKIYSSESLFGFRGGGLVEMNYVLLIHSCLEISFDLSVNYFTLSRLVNTN